MRTHHECLRCNKTFATVEKWAAHDPRYCIEVKHGIQLANMYDLREKNEGASLPKQKISSLPGGSR